MRAMELISSMEPDRRGVYGGAVGYASFNNSMDWCIAIRYSFSQKIQDYIFVLIFLKGLLSSKMGWPMDKQEQELCTIVTQ